MKAFLEITDEQRESILLSAGVVPLKYELQKDGTVVAKYPPHTIVFVNGSYIVSVKH